MVARSPQASLVLGQVLRATETLPVLAALDVESFAYSMLLGGKEFGHWLSGNEDREPLKYKDFLQGQQRILLSDLKMAADSAHTNPDPLSRSALELLRLGTCRMGFPNGRQSGHQSWLPSRRERGQMTDKLPFASMSHC
jgi:hypothetical protein